jgi:hypothetical protein
MSLGKFFLKYFSNTREQKSVKRVINTKSDITGNHKEAFLEDIKNIEPGMFYRGVTDTYGKCIFREGELLTVFALSSKWPYGELGSLRPERIAQIISSNDFKTKVLEIVMNHSQLITEQKSSCLKNISKETGISF